MDKWINQNSQYILGTKPAFASGNAKRCTLEARGVRSIKSESNVKAGFGFYWPMQHIVHASVKKKGTRAPAFCPRCNVVNQSQCSAGYYA